MAVSGGGLAYPGDVSVLVALVALLAPYRSLKGFGIEQLGLVDEAGIDNCIGGCW